MIFSLSLSDRYECFNLFKVLIMDADDTTQTVKERLAGVEVRTKLIQNPSQSAKM